MLFAKRKQLKNLSVLLTGDGTTLVLDTLLLKKKLRSFYETHGGIKFRS